MGMVHILENEGYIECANLRHDVRQGRPGNKCQIERAELEGLKHFDFAAKRGVRVLLHGEPPAAALGDLVGERRGTSSELGILRQNISDFQGAGRLRLKRRHAKHGRRRDCEDLCRAD